MANSGIAPTGNQIVPGVNANYTYTDIKPVENQPGIYSAMFDPDGDDSEPPREVFFVKGDAWRLKVFRFDKVEDAIEFNDFVSSKKFVALDGSNYYSSQATSALKGENEDGTFHGYTVQSNGNKYNSQRVSIDGRPGLQVCVLTKEGQGVVTDYDTNEYFGTGIPGLPPSLQVHIDQPFDPESNSPVQFATQLAGVQGAAMEVYNTAGYGTTPLPDITETLNSKTLRLITLIFGDGVKPNQGHLNTLKALQLVKGTVPEGAEKWVVTAKGEEILAAVPLDDQGNPISLPMLGNLGMATIKSPSRFEQETDLSGFFEPGSTPPKLKEGVDLTAVVAKLRGAKELISAKVSPGPLPAGLKVEGDLKEMLVNVLGDMELTSNHLNVAIAAGLITYNPSNNTLTLNPHGAALQAALDNTPATPPTTTPPDGSQPPAVDAKTYEFLQTLSRASFLRIFDTGANNNNSPDNDVSRSDLERLANWSDGQEYTYYVNNSGGRVSTPKTISADDMAKIKAAANWLLTQMDANKPHASFGTGFGFNGGPGDWWIAEFQNVQQAINAWTQTNKPPAT